MPSETVRITPAAHHTLKDLSDRIGEPMTVVLERALEAYRRRLFLEECRLAFEKMRADPKAWAQEKAERDAWDATVGDGMKDA